MLTTILSPFRTIYHELASCDAEDYREAFREILLAIFFGVLPLWLTFALFLPIEDGNALEFFASFFSNGNAYIASAATVGPIFYMLIKNYGEFEDHRVSFTFPLAFTVLIFTGLIVFFSSVFFLSITFVETMNGTDHNDSLFTVSSGFAFGSGFFILSFSFVFLFFVAALRNMMERSPASRMSASSRGFLNSLGIETSTDPKDPDNGGDHDGAA